MHDVLLPREALRSSTVNVASFSFLGKYLMFRQRLRTDPLDTAWWELG